MEVGFDTEFVSEDTFQSELCLIQVATRDKTAIIDTLAVPDISCFWDLLTESDRPVIAHASREEFVFCFRATGKKIKSLFDIQVAAGMLGMEYPAAYGTLVSKIVGKTIDKGETRTDWRRRPLTRSQLDYAAQDVVHLHRIYDQFVSELNKYDRLPWLEDEMRRRQDDLVENLTGKAWRKLSGLSNLAAKNLNIARELWKWREGVAERNNRPARRVLRDDLLVEIAKRGRAETSRIKSLRGMERRDFSQHIDAISRCVQSALKIPKSDWPTQKKHKSLPQVNLLGQYLAAALSTICRDAKIASGIVGSVQDVRSWIVYKLYGKKNGEVPTLAKGWRAEIIGKRLEQVMNGKLAIVVSNPKADQPLTLKKVD